ncbi:hypothetical protein BH09PAT3_BH09PAT3_6460 [soil metagenome]
MEQKSKPDSPQPTQLPTAEQQLFIGTLLSLTWQLLIVVVVPFVGGHFLDERYDTAPLYTLIGLGLALALAALVTYRGYQTLTQAQSKSEKKHD